MNIDWLKAAGIRAVKTFAQSAVALITAQATGLLDVDWEALASVSGLAALVSVLTSLGGLPEAGTPRTGGE